MWNFKFAWKKKKKKKKKMKEKEIAWTLRIEPCDARRHNSKI